MKEILQTIRDLNRAFGHNAEPVFVNTETREIDSSHSPTFRANPVSTDLVFNWMEGNFGYVHPDYPNLLFFAVDRLGDPAVFTCCGIPLLFACSTCGEVHPISPRSLANHEFIHSLQLRTNPRISHADAEKTADELELMDLVKIVNMI